MTGLTYDSEHVARGTARLIDRYRFPRTSALLGSWLAEAQELEDALWQLLVERSLDTAEGAQLDVLGDIVGQPRRGMSDDEYRVWIEARNLVHRSSGLTTEILAIARMLVPAGTTIRLEESYPASFVMRMDGVDLTLDGLGYQVANMLHLAKAAGVLFEMTWPMVLGQTFTLSPDPAAPVPSSPLGFESGWFAFVTDGATVPPEVDVPETGLPAGQLVIHGAPLQIQGAPLVITGGAAVHAPPPPRPVVQATVLAARIVPHYSRAALPATTAAGPAPIELADAFADTSLEMDAAGQKFRVAQEMQTDLGDVQDSVTALNAELDGVETTVAAMRWPFTLRTTSVANTAFEEIGVMRFDSSSVGGAITLVAELEVAAAGESVELQLYNLTAGAVVTTVSSTSIVTQKVTASLTLPLSEALYSVRLRRVGGGSGDRVSCRSVVFEATHA